MTDITMYVTVQHKCLWQWNTFIIAPGPSHGYVPEFSRWAYWDTPHGRKNGRTDIQCSILSLTWFIEFVPDNMYAKPSHGKILSRATSLRAPSFGGVRTWVEDLPMWTSHNTAEASNLCKSMHTQEEHRGNPSQSQKCVLGYIHAFLHTWVCVVYNAVFSVSMWVGVCVWKSLSLVHHIRY